MSEPDLSESSLTEAELYRIAGEVGLSEKHVRRALADVRSGAASGNLLDRIFGPSSIRASRVVSRTPEQIAREMDDFLVASQLLQPVRRAGGVLQYRPAVDWASQLARAASFTSRKYYIASAKSVEVHLETIDEDRTVVEILVDPGTRNDDIAAAVFGGGVGGGGIGVVAAWGIATISPLGVAIGIGAVAGAGIWSGIGYLAGKSHKKKLLEVQWELESVLDALESGASLEPPPASWRRWVKRHFHGVARDLIRAEGETEI